MSRRSTRCGAWTQGTARVVASVPWFAHEDPASRRLIIQTIRRDPYGSLWTDGAPNLSRVDPSGADQIDAEHQATDLAVGGSNPSRRAKRAAQRCCSKISRKHPAIDNVKRLLEP